MANAESASTSLGPRYAPEDPTLPKPWKGLIDGTTGLSYYWNPETNVTQYERPTSLAPPLPPGPPPSVTTPKLAPIPMARTPQSNGVLPHQGQQMSQAPSSQVQQMSQTGQQHGQVIPQQQGSQSHATQQQSPQVAQHVSQMAQPMQQPEQLPQQQFRQPMSQHPGQQMPQQLGQQVPHYLGQQMQQQLGQQTPQTLGQQSPQQPGQQMQPHFGQLTSQFQGQQMSQQHGQQFPHQQLQQMPYQQSLHPQGQQMQHQHAPNLSHQQGQQYPQPTQQFQQPQQMQTMNFPQREAFDFQQGKQFPVPSSQIQHSGVTSLHNTPSGTHSVQMPLTGVQSVRPQQYSSPSVHVPQSASSSVQSSQAGNDAIHPQHMGGTMIQNQTPMMHNQQSGGPPTGLNVSKEEDPRGRAGNEFYFNANKEGPVSGPQQPKHPAAAVPMARIHQEMRMGGVPPQNVAPGHSGAVNMTSGHATPNMYNHAGGGQAFPCNSAPVRPPSRALAPSDVPDLSPAEAYRRQHEVTATVCI